MKVYTDEKYRKDKKKLIGVGLLICAFIIFLLHNWNIERLAKMRAERMEIERQRQIDAEKVEEEPTIPGFRGPFGFDQIITPEMMDEITERIGKDKIYDQEKKFTNFKITIFSGWQEIEKGELEGVFPGIIYEIDKANAKILFLAHNFNIEKMVIDMLKRGDIGMLDMPEIDLRQIKFQEIMLFNIIEFREVEKVDDFIRIIKELDARNEHFKIIEKNIVEIAEKDENEIRIEAKYFVSQSQKIDGKIQEVKIYSYKKAILIDKNLYAFIFLSDSKITGDNRKEVDKILGSVIIN